MQKQEIDKKAQNNPKRRTGKPYQSSSVKSITATLFLLLLKGLRAVTSCSSSFTSDLTSTLMRFTRASSILAALAFAIVSSRPCLKTEKYEPVAASTYSPLPWTSSHSAELAPVHPHAASFVIVYCTTEEEALEFVPAAPSCWVLCHAPSIYLGRIKEVADEKSFYLCWRSGSKTR